MVHSKFRTALLTASVVLTLPNTTVHIFPLVQPKDKFVISEFRTINTMFIMTILN